MDNLSMEISTLWAIYAKYEDKTIDNANSDQRINDPLIKYWDMTKKF